jgi:hypothetical protein
LQCESWAAAGTLAGGAIVAAGSVVADAGTFGVNIAATPLELAGGAAAGGVIAGCICEVIPLIAQGVQSIWDHILLMAKGATQNKENEYSREARAHPDPCKWLEEQYNSTGCSSENRQKIKMAQKVLGCRKNSTQR